MFPTNRLQERSELPVAVAELEAECRQSPWPPLRTFLDSVQPGDLLFRYRESGPDGGHEGYIRRTAAGAEVVLNVSTWMC